MLQVFSNLGCKIAILGILHPNANALKHALKVWNQSNFIISKKGDVANHMSKSEEKY